MQSEKQIQASKTNGARSRGPITEKGKQNSARNSAHHGLLAQTVVLNEESADRFQELLAAYMDDYKPRSASQVSLVESMAVARWRLLRIWGVQKSTMDRDMALQDPNLGAAPIRASVALRGSQESLCPPELLLRYEIAFDRQFSRALTRLLTLQALPAARQPIPYHSDTPAGQTWKEENIPLPNEPGKELKPNGSPDSEPQP